MKNQAKKMTIALIAHDGKKAEMVGFVRDHRDVLERNGIQLIATGTTGNHIQRAGFRSSAWPAARSAEMPKSRAESLKARCRW